MGAWAKLVATVLTYPIQLAQARLRAMKVGFAKKNKNSVFYCFCRQKAEALLKKAKMEKSSTSILEQSTCSSRSCKMTDLLVCFAEWKQRFTKLSLLQR